MNTSHNTQYQKESEGGFTLIEVMVSVALFSVVMTICTTALLSLVDANKKSQAIQSVMLNLNVALDGMVRSLRMGTGYRVEPVGSTCTVCTQMSFFPFGTTSFIDANRVYFRLQDTNGDGKNEITKQYVPKGFAGSVTVPITAKEVEINQLAFYFEGNLASGIADGKQPRVLIIIRGTAGAEKVKTTTSFNVQASATQRLLDI
ncbi:MAG: type II secretion system protein [Minisyncoccia bacterium]